MFFAIPFFLLELYLSLKMGETIGFLWSAIWIVATILIGTVLLQNSPNAIMSQMQSVQKGKLNLKKFQDASMSYFIGSILLIVPGVLSDFVGVVALAYTVYLHFIAKITPEQTNNYTKKGDNDVIDVEIIDEHTDRIDRS
ncbi:MAG: FxsA family protein [Sulfurovum sp.]|nr:FxsA family protein [Sulfurovum sp.]